MKINITTNTTSKEYDLESFNKGVVSFGRSSECDIQIGATFVSRVHGCFYFENGYWKVQDLESRNGIYKNGKKIVSSPLRDGETIEIRNTKKPAETIKIIASNVVDKKKTGSSIKNEKKNRDSKNKGASKTDSSNKDSQTKDSKALIFVIIGAGVAVLLLVVVLLVVFSKRSSGGPAGPSSSASTESEDYYEGEEDMEAYYNENSTVVSVTDAASSSTVKTEKDAISELDDRGFGQYEVESDFDMAGELLDDPVMEESSSDKHPMYTTNYCNSSEELWVVYFVDDRVMAFPVSYNDQSDRVAPVMITEDDTVMSYDCYSNKFYETIPKDSELIVVNISKINDEKISGGKINTDILDVLTIEEIDHYVDK